MTITAPKRATYLATLSKPQACGACTNGGDHKEGCHKTIDKGQPAYQLGTRYYHPTCLPAAAKDALAESLGLSATPAPAEPVATGSTVNDAERAALDAIMALGGGKATIDEADVLRICGDLLNTARPVEVSSGSIKLGKTEGAAHPLLDEILRLVTTSIGGKRLPAFLVGPAGSGKTHLGHQVAEALKLPFHSISCSAGMSEGHLLGRLLPIEEGGRFSYVPSELVTAYENGGVYLMDEVDAADPNTLLVLNSAIANGHLGVPMRTDNPVALRHPDFVLLLAANTFGTGANRTYAGRNALDGAFLNRLSTGTLNVDYDEKLEERLCGSKAVAAAFRKLRKKVDAKGIRRIVSMRNTIEAAATYSGGPNPKGWRTMDECIAALTSAWTEEERRACGLSGE